jgi:hypothetical protein
MNTARTLRVAFTAGLARAQPGPGAAPQIKLTPLKPGAIYEVGEKLGWTVTTGGTPPTAPVTYTLKKNGLTVYKTDTLDLSTGSGKIETSLDEPGSVVLELQNAPAAAAAGSPCRRALWSPPKNFSPHRRDRPILTLGGTSRSRSCTPSPPTRN